jgi:putative tryptophan/tyrosine transport system substrate-binding protein
MTITLSKRKLIAIIAGAAAWPISARAQTTKRPLIALFGISSQTIAARNVNAFLQGLREFGHEDGRDIDIVYRWADGDLARQPALARELVALKPDVIVPLNGAGAVAAVRATQTIPIIGPMISDPIGQGLAASYNQPGGNVTGILLTQDGLTGKQLSLLVELIPHADAIALLINPSDRVYERIGREAEAAARNLSVRLVRAEVRGADDLEPAFEALKREAVSGLLVLQDPLFFTQATRIVALAAAVRLPTMYGFREHVERGGLISYSVDVEQNCRRAAHFVDRILKGARPADLPIEFPVRLELVINLNTAKALGLTVPQKLLATADEVIE